MKKFEPKDWLLTLSLSMAFSLFVGYGLISLGGCEMNLCVKILASVMLVIPIILIWCCKDCSKEEKDSTNQAQIQSFNYSFTAEYDGKKCEIKISDFQTIPKENSK